MAMTREDLSRPIKLDCCKDGTITIRKPGEQAFNGKALSFFSTETWDEAQALRVVCCKAQYSEHPLLPGQTWYRDATFGGELEDLGTLADRYREKLAWIRERQQAS